ncbi:hypothetical protein [Agrobacterium tumefaciens]|uniref:hypothetical protein n=1 Tax=Agrobacterium tumefaciens TaxID=358 RepID=UPI00157317E0|nr:hypothetical protein [Agrobacterium tumefaciens]NTB05788.1 hypothetical protein [Agrobacterium tumefaciens]
MKLFVFVTVICLSSLSAHAQERTAGGTLQTQASWNALQSLYEQANGTAKNAHFRLNQAEKCADKGMLYAPNSSNKDGDGCKQVSMPDPAKLNIEVHTQALCKRGGNHSVVSTCPQNERLLGCGGGPGDMDSSHEYWVLMPDFSNNRCVGYVGNPACYDNGWSRTIVSAVCYRP